MRIPKLGIVNKPSESRGSRQESLVTGKREWRGLGWGERVGKTGTSVKLSVDWGSSITESNTPGSGWVNEAGNSNG